MNEQIRPDYKKRKAGNPTMAVSDRIKKRIAINTVTGCWEWIGSKKNGYGHTIIGSRTNGTRKTISAHRLSFITFNGEIPDGYEICHKCDNPCCVNPDHLFLGTRQDNVDDRERKCRNIVKVGEEQPNAKLNKKAVKYCREQHFLRGASFNSLAKQFGVNKKTMQNAVKGNTWKCVSYMPEPPKEVDHES